MPKHGVEVLKGDGKDSADGGRDAPGYTWSSTSTKRLKFVTKTYKIK
jgi:hypothetical protein